MALLHHSVCLVNHKISQVLQTADMLFTLKLNAARRYLKNHPFDRKRLHSNFTVGYMKKKKNARHWCLQSSRKCLQLYLSFLTAFYERKNLHDIGNPNSCWKLHRTIDLMRNIPTCTSVCRLFQISKRKWISTTYDTWGTYIGNQIPQSSRGGYYYLRTLV